MRPLALVVKYYPQNLASQGKPPDLHYVTCLAAGAISQKTHRMTCGARLTAAYQHCLNHVNKSLSISLLT